MVFEATRPRGGAELMFASVASLVVLLEQSICDNASLAVRHGTTDFMRAISAVDIVIVWGIPDRPPTKSHAEERARFCRGI